MYIIFQKACSSKCFDWPQRTSTLMVCYVHDLQTIWIHTICWSELLRLNIAGIIKHALMCTAEKSFLLIHTGTCTIMCREYLSQVVLVLNMSRDEKLLIKSHINVISTKWTRKWKREVLKYELLDRINRFWMQSIFFLVKVLKSYIWDKLNSNKGIFNTNYSSEQLLYQ